MNQLARIETGTPIAMAEFAEKARDYAGLAKSANTRRAYKADWTSFETWCAARGAAPMPASPATVLAYLIDHAGAVKVATLQRRLSAIREAHKYAGHVLDTGSVAFRDAWTGIRRAHGQPANQKAAVMTSDLRKALAALPDTLTGQRDRALLLVGFAGALRRSELAGLEVAPRDGCPGWIDDTPDGLVVRLARSKTDQEGQGAEIGIPYGTDPNTCPVRAYRAWLLASYIDSGPAFRPINRHGRMAAKALTDKAVARIVKRSIVAAARADGMSLAEAQARAARFAGHSLRAGLATSAAANDAPGHAIQRQLRHRKYDTTVKYIRAGQLFKQNAAGMAGL